MNLASGRKGRSRGEGQERRVSDQPTTLPKLICGIRILRCSRTEEQYNLEEASAEILRLRAENEDLRGQVRALQSGNQGAAAEAARPIAPPRRHSSYFPLDPLPSQSSLGAHQTQQSFPAFHYPSPSFPAFPSHYGPQTPSVGSAASSSLFNIFNSFGDHTLPIIGGPTSTAEEGEAHVFPPVPPRQGFEGQEESDMNDDGADRAENGEEGGAGQPRQADELDRDGEGRDRGRRKKKGSRDKSRGDSGGWRASVK